MEGREREEDGVEETVKKIDVSPSNLPKKKVTTNQIGGRKRTKELGPRMLVGRGDRRRERIGRRSRNRDCLITKERGGRRSAPRKKWKYRELLGPPFFAIRQCCYCSSLVREDLIVVF